MHIITSPLPEHTTLADAITAGAEHYAADLPGLYFAQLSWGPVVVLSDSTVREAEYIARADGFTWVVAA